MVLGRRAVGRGRARGRRGKSAVGGQFRAWGLGWVFVGGEPGRRRGGMWEREGCARASWACFCSIS